MIRSPKLLEFVANLEHMEADAAAQKDGDAWVRRMVDMIEGMEDSDASRAVFMLEDLKNRMPK